MNKKPHVLIFNPDQFRADALGHLGNSASFTPNFDKIVEEDAVSFKNCFCQNPVCTPSRCSFMSGLYPHVNGHRTMHNMMKEHEPVLLQTLKENGYFVWWGGKNDLVPGDAELSKYCDIHYKTCKSMRTNLHVDQSWRQPEGTEGYYSFYAGKLETNGDIALGEEVFYDKDWANVEGAVEFIKKYNGDKPLCIYMPLGYPHPPYGVEEPWYSKINREALKERIKTPLDSSKKPSILSGIRKNQNLENWTEDKWNELRATYLGMCSRIDYQFGLVVQALKDSGIYDDTLIFVFSDHGDFTGDYGLVEKTQNTFEDCLTNVPFILKAPKWLNVEGKVSDELVELIDFYGTVEDIVGFESTHTHFGKSLIPVIKGEKSGNRDAVFCEGGRNHGEIQCMEKQSISNSSPQGLYWPRLMLQSQEGPEHGKAIMCRTQKYKYVKRLYEKDELYDLQEDPKELINLIDDERYKEVLTALKERLLNHYMETCDIVPIKADVR